LILILILFAAGDEAATPKLGHAEDERAASVYVATPKETN